MKTTHRLALFALTLSGLTQAHAALDVTLTGKVASATETQYQPKRIPNVQVGTDYAGHPVYQDMWDYAHPVGTTTPIQQMGGLTVGGDVTLHMSIDPDTWVIASASLDQGSAGQLVGAFPASYPKKAIVGTNGLKGEQLSFENILNFAPVYWNSAINFAPGTLSATPTAADFVQAIANGALQSASGSVVFLGTCQYSGSGYLNGPQVCGSAKLSFDTATFNLNGLSATASVPEPATHALWLLGLGGMAWLRARARKPGSGRD
jgi:hypothetical protein